MKINKGMSVLLASMLVGGMLVGCGHNNTDTTKAITKSVKATEDKKGETPPKDNKESSSKNIPESVKKKSKAKETITVESYKCKYCGDTIYYIIEDKEYGINGDICWVCYWNKIMETIEDDVETEDNVEVDDSDIEEDDVETEASDNNEDYDDEDYDDGELDEEYYEYENSDDDYDYDTEDDYDTEEYDDDYDDEPSDTYEIENYNEEEE